MMTFKRINILFLFIQMDVMGGSESLVYNLVRKIDRTLFTPSVGWFFGGEPLDAFQHLGIPLYHIPKTRRLDLSAMQFLRNIIKKNDIHIVNAHHFMSMLYSFYGCKLTNRIKLIYTEHSKWEIEDIRWRWKILGRHILNYIDCSVGVSPSVTHALKDQFQINRSELITIRNGIDIDVFAKQNEEAYLKHQLNIPKNDRVIGTVANLKTVKNHIFLVEAFHALADCRNDVKLLIIGRGVDEAPDNTEHELREFVRRTGLGNRVIFLGYRDDIPNLLSIIDIFCITSLREGLPLSLIEAMAVGIPAVGTDVDGIKDIIVHNKTGFLVPLDDVQALKSALIKLLDDKELRLKLGRYAKTLSKEQYSLARCIDKYQALFLSLMAAKPPQSEMA
jgi:glycosyltransferase involved in cell wall biosynthesis